MTKEFKWKPGDIVWFMYKDKATLGEIASCWYRKSISCVDFETVSDIENYRISVAGKDLNDTFDLKSLFPDKESLIKSL
jgi:hypothetical protein